MDQLEITGQNEETVAKQEERVSNARSVPKKNLANKQSKKRRVTGDIAPLVANVPPKGALYICCSSKTTPPTRHATVIVNI